MKIVKHAAKYVCTMIGPLGLGATCIEGPRNEKNHSKGKENQRDFQRPSRATGGLQNFCLVNDWEYIGSISAPDETTLKEESHALQCTTTGPYHAIPTDLLRAGSACSLGSDVCGIYIYIYPQSSCTFQNDRQFRYARQWPCEYPSSSGIRPCLPSSSHSRKGGKGPENVNGV